MIVRAEHSWRGGIPRFVVTCDAAEIYNQLYCARGEAENRIKGQRWIYLPIASVA